MEDLENDSIASRTRSSRRLAVAGRMSLVRRPSDTAAAHRQRRCRAHESVDHRRTRLQQNAQRQRDRRNLTRQGFNETSQNTDSSAISAITPSSHPQRVLGAALTIRNPTEHDLGRMTYDCAHCGAQHFKAEVKSQHPHVFADCCDLGRLLIRKFDEFPRVLRNLFIRDHHFGTGVGARHRNFHENIRNFNSALAMASTGAKIVSPRGRGPYCYRIHDQIYHRIGPLHPAEGESRQYGQIYILDTEQATAQRLQLTENRKCDAEIMNVLSSLIASINPYARAFKMMNEIEQAEESLAAREHRPSPKLRMTFEASGLRGLESRPYDLPTCNEVAVVYVAEDEDIPSTRAVAVHQRGGNLTSISDLDKRCDPLAYPLFFPTGQDGWHPLLMNSENKRISQKVYYAHLLSVRANEFNPLLFGGKLFQQFVVDAYVKIEQNRLNYHRTHQKELRVETYSGLCDHFHTGDETGPPGRRIVLPSSFIGSPRNMQQNYQDAMAIVAHHGKPDIFLTITCNPKWAEIQDNLSPGQTASDRPDIVSRVFYLKLKELCEDLFKNYVFGKIVASVSVVEFQKRGLPHCHMLLILSSESKPRGGDDVDRFCCAEIPNPITENRLHQAVKTFMIHRRCGIGSNAPCMREDKCTKKFPKSFREVTSVSNDGYPELRRRDQYQITTDDGVYTDASVVPYNPYLLLKYNSHINVEICGWISAVKYLYKYIYKGSDKASLVITSGKDEILGYLNARYVCAPEAMHRIYGYDLQKKSHTVYRLAVHLPNFQTVTFQQGSEREAMENAQHRLTTLTAFFKLNADSASNAMDITSTFQDSRRYYYGELPQHYTFTPRNGWKTRQRNSKPIIGRMYTVQPKDTERYAIRMLLLHTKGATSFENLRTIHGQLYHTFQAAAKAAGFMDDDQYVRDSLQEAATFQMPGSFRSFFASVLSFCEVTDGCSLWNDFADALAEDFVHRGYSSEQAKVFAYFEIDDRLKVHGKRFQDFVPPPQAHRPQIPELPIDYGGHENEGSRMYATLNPNQKKAADAILSALGGQNSNHLFFIDGPGGSGKTYLYNTLYNIFIGKRKNVLCVAWTGIAANLLPKGRTVHSTFKLNISNNNRSSSMTRRQATPLIETDLIIWDEISMVSKNALQTVDELLRDMTQNHEPFGGKLILVGGDFRQTLPIVQRGTKVEILEACIKNSHLWQQFKTYSLTQNMRARDAGTAWQTFLLDVGSGDINDANDCISVPETFVCRSNLTTAIFGEEMDSSQTEDLTERTILATKNTHVNFLNDEALNRLKIQSPMDERTYKSWDSIMTDSNDDRNTMPIEYLNSLTPSGLPPHVLRLKKGAIVMLLRNLDVNNGLCNGTRMKVESLARHTIICSLITGERKGQLAILGRLDLYWDGAPFRLRRRQFPLRIAFAMTINKSQGQTFKWVGLYLPEDVFGHGQLYTALSRLKDPSHLRISSSKDLLKNVVYKEIFLM